MKPITVVTFNDPEPAEALRIRLESAGHHASHSDESGMQRFWFLTEPRAAHKVEVAEEGLASARQLIEKWNRADGVLRGAVCCPQCHGSRVEYPQFTGKFLTPAFAELLVTLRVFPTMFYCQDCQFTWPKEEEPKPDFDLLNWPNKSRWWHPEARREGAARAKAGS
ncbi:MAG: hypothetical protein EXS29_07600 [Pedosphaera sp.]|nr:hypothetical protein [Pedosphaera sp.]MST01158.1 hypothetical protein [Pedosphaera sp.]